MVILKYAFHYICACDLNIVKHPLTSIKCESRFVKENLFTVEPDSSIDSEHILPRAADVKPTLPVPAVIPDTPSPTRKKPKLKKKTLKRKVNNISKTLI